MCIIDWSSDGGSPVRPRCQGKGGDRRINQPRPVEMVVPCPGRIGNGQPFGQEFDVYGIEIELEIAFDIHRAAGQPAGDALDRIFQETALGDVERSEEHTSELQSLMRISYAVFCLKKKK